MESYSNLTETELLHEINKAKEWHEAIKREILTIANEIENLEKTANEKLQQLETIEKNYVDLMQEMTSRENA